MVVSEKLELFRKEAMEDAQSRGKKELAALRASLKETFDDHRKEKEAAARAQIAEETIRIRREELLRVSEYRQEARREQARKERDLSEKLFSLVEEKLSACRKTAAYGEYLVRQAVRAKEFAGGEVLQFFLDAEDQPEFAAIEAATGIRPQVSPDRLGGGIRAVIPGRRICIENAWSSLLADARKSYQFGEA